MNDDTKKAIAVLAEKIRVKEDELNKLKRVVNDLCGDEDEAPLYQNVGAESTGTLHSLRSDHFYGQTLGAAAKQYLEIRKASGLGAASVNEIYGALKTGGYRFDTASEENAKTGVRISLRKSSSIFHKLPNGHYGLTAWYGVKGSQQNSETRKSSKKAAKRKAKAQHEKKTSVSNSTESTVVAAPEPDDSKANGELTSVTNQITQLLACSPNKQWTSDEILSRVPNAQKTSLPTLLSRLKRDKKIQKVGKGLWKTTG